MSRKKSDEKPAGATLKVHPATLETLKKLVAMRELKTLADLFLERDVEDFLNHLYAGELAKEAARLKAQKKPSQ